MPEDRSLSFDFTLKAPQPVPVIEEPAPLTVGELDRAIKGAIDGAFSTSVWVEGEVADARPAPSGHLYFCLKDEKEEASIDMGDGDVWHSSVRFEYSNVHAPQL